jgi:hypothetical protein
VGGGISAAGGTKNRDDKARKLLKTLESASQDCTSIANWKFIRGG